MEMLQMINLSTQSKATMSQEDGVKLNPLVSNPEQTIKQLQAESAAQAKLDIFASTINGGQNGEE